MAYDVATRLDLLGTRMKEINDNSLTYTRSGFAAITIEDFTPGRVDVSQLAVAGIVLVTEKIQDFIFDTDDLSSLSPATPQVGDQITWGSNIYEVMSIGEETYNYTTSSRNRIRVHTKQTSVVT